MVQQIPFEGSTVNDGTGNDLRTGAVAWNANFTELYTGSIDIVRDHSAVGDASLSTASWTGTGNTTAIQAAVDAALDSTYKYGAKVTLPPGNFLCGELDLTSVDARGLIIEGSGWRTRLIVNANTTDGLFKVGRSRITIRDMTLDGNGGLFDSNLIKIVDEHGWALKLHNLQLVNCTQVALLSDAPVSSGGNILTVDECLFSGGDLGFVTLDHATRGRISNSIFQAGGVAGAGLPHAIKISNTQTAQRHNFKIDNSWFEWTGVDLNNVDDGFGDSRVITPVIVDAFGVIVTDNFFTISSGMTQIESAIEVTGNGDQSWIGRNDFVACGKMAPNILVQDAARRITLYKNRGLHTAQDFNATMLIVPSHGDAFVDVIPMQQSTTTAEITSTFRAYSSPSVVLTSRTQSTAPVAYYSKTRGHLSPAHTDTTAQIRGDMVSNGGNCYFCITNGTTGTGTAPTSTTVNSDETDGTVHWTYMGEAGEFYTSIEMHTNGGDWA